MNGQRNVEDAAPAGFLRGWQDVDALPDEVLMVLGESFGDDDGARILAWWESEDSQRSASLVEVDGQGFALASASPRPGGPVTGVRLVIGSSSIRVERYEVDAKPVDVPPGDRRAALRIGQEMARALLARSGVGGELDGGSR